MAAGESLNIGKTALPREISWAPAQVFFRTVSLFWLLLIPKMPTEKRA